MMKITCYVATCSLSEILSRLLFGMRSCFHTWQFWDRLWELVSIRSIMFQCLFLGLSQWCGMWKSKQGWWVCAVYEYWTIWHWFLFKIQFLHHLLVMVLVLTLLMVRASLTNFTVDFILEPTSRSVAQPSSFCTAMFLLPVEVKQSPMNWLTSCTICYVSALLFMIEWSK